MINVIGMGYIGLPTALMLATHGNEIVGTDYNESIIEKLSNKKITFEEEGLQELFSEAISAGITFTSEYQKTSTYIITVPTPYDQRTKKVDASYIVCAFEKVLEVCLPNAVIVIESTISPGTIDTFIRPIADKSDKKVQLVHAPERIIPGNMIYELVNNNRTIGADDLNIGNKIKDIYASFCKGEIVVTDIKTAEMTKVIENTYRAVNIAFANEITQICSTCGMDVYEVIRICNMHPRVNILNPGPGVGGHCIPIDPWFLVGDYPMLTRVIGESMKLNRDMPGFVLKQLSQIMKKHGISDVSEVGIYGLTYKENTDDVRESPTLQLLERQKENLGNPIKVYDPMINRRIVTNQVFDMKEFLDGTKLVVLMVGHDHIKENFGNLFGKIIYDTRNVIPASNDYTLYKLGGII